MNKWKQLTIIFQFMLVCSLLLAVFSTEARAAYQTFYYGSYAQEHVTDESLINELNNNQDFADDGRAVVDGIEYVKKNREYFVKEPIAWIALKETDDYYLLLSKKLLEERTFGDDFWVDSSIRKWLNEDFYKNAFTSKEQSDIYAPGVETWYRSYEDAYINGVEGRYLTTTDNVFLLSTDEYLSLDDGSNEGLSVAKATQYYSMDEKEARWWLRGHSRWSTGNLQNAYARSTAEGAPLEVDYWYGTYSYGVRPCICVYKNSSYLKTKKPTLKPAKKTPEVGDTFTIGKLTYVITKKDANVALKKVATSKTKTLTIPAKVTYKDISYKVTSIKKSACAKCKKITEVVIGKNVTKIGDTAFKNCTKLKKADFTKATKLKTVGESIFSGCSSLKRITMKVSTISVASPIKGKATLTCTEVVNASGYEFYYGYKSLNGTVQKNVKADSPKKTLSNMAADEAYTFKVRPYIKSGSDYYYGAYSKEISKIVNAEKEAAIYFDGNGATNKTTMDSIVVGELKNVELPKNEFKKSGYKFVGWSTSKSSDFAAYKDAGTVSAKKLKKAITLYALWDKNETGYGKAVRISGLSDARSASTYTAYYNEDYFSGDSTAINSDLVKLSALAAAGTYKSGQAESVLNQCGMKKDAQRRVFSGAVRQEHKDMTHSTVEDNDHAIAIMGCKTMADGRLLIAVCVNGYSKGNYEWISNFNLGPSKTHAGFDAAASELVIQVEDYVTEKKAEGQEAVIWIAGHSRGAAVTNLVAQKLMDEHGYTAENIYAFGFATPRYTTGLTEDEKAQYSNIINYVSPHDFVPYVAPEAWHYDRLGQTITFKDPNCKSAMEKAFSNLTGENYGGYTKKGRENIVDEFVKLGVSQSEYATTEYIGDMRVVFTAEEYAKNGIGRAMSADSLEGAATMIALGKTPSPASNLTGMLIYDGKITPKIKHAHFMVTYLSWLDAMYAGGSAVH